jgi:hypothetical protein
MVHDPLKTKNGKPIKYVGQWKDPENTNQLQSTITAIHGVHGECGPYREACVECMALADDSNSRDAPFTLFNQHFFTWAIQVKASTSRTR